MTRSKIRIIRCIVKSCVDFLSQGWQKMYPPEWLRTDYGNYGSGGSYINVVAEGGLSALL